MIRQGAWAPCPFFPALTPLPVNSSLLISLSLLLLGPCKPPETREKTPQATQAQPLADSTLAERFAPPEGWTRVSAPKGSFAEWLRNLPLKPEGSPVLLHNGTPKGNQQAHLAVVDLPIGKRDLHQCADAVMHLKARYLYETGQEEKIGFHLTNGFWVPWLRWKNGERVKVTGNTTAWVKTAAADGSAVNFWKYLEFIFTYAGTLSLEKELTPVRWMDMQTGDVLIRGGSPGHAVLVADMVERTSDGKKMFLLIQSYMPAQEAQVLRNPASTSGWYELVPTDVLDTPEWRFDSGQLRR
jgi:hypothetical protein